MPLYLWLLLGGVSAYLVFKGGATAANGTTSSGAASSGATQTIQVQDPSGNSYSMVVDSGIPLATIQQIQTFFHTSGQTDATVLALSQQLLAAGYSVASGSVQTTWQIIEQSQVASSSAAAAGGGGVFQGFITPGHLGGGGGSSSEQTETTPKYSAASAQAPAANLAVRDISLNQINKI